MVYFFFAIFISSIVLSNDAFETQMKDQFPVQSQHDFECLGQILGLTKIMMKSHELTNRMLNSGEWKVHYKAGDEPYTDIDIAVNELMLEGLRRDFKDIAILSEEGPIPHFSDLQKEKRFFALDPIDGTNNLVEGYSGYTNLLALMEEGNKNSFYYPKIGLINYPDKNQLLIGVEGRGTWNWDYETQILSRVYSSSNPGITSSSWATELFEINQYLRILSPRNHRQLLKKQLAVGDRFYESVHGTIDNFVIPFDGMSLWDMGAPTVIYRNATYDDHPRNQAPKGYYIIDNDYRIGPHVFGNNIVVESKYGLNSFLKYSEGDISFGEDFLHYRQKAIISISDAFENAAKKIVEVYNGHYDTNKEVRLPSGPTRNIYSSLIDQLSIQEENIFYHVTEAVSHVSPLFKVFGWSFNRMKKIHSNEADHIEMVTRNALGNLELPYPIHSHFDLPLSMKALGFKSKTLSLALAFSHDALEEGNYITRKSNQLIANPIELKYLEKIFPEQNFGKKLSIGINALTESEFDELRFQISHHRMKKYKETYDAYIKSITKKFPGNEGIYFDKISVYGGLALQVQRTVEGLILQPNLTLSKVERIKLAQSLIEVEMADRVSDIATMDRLVFDNDLESSRLWIKGYVARMLNMHHKLGEAASLIPATSWSQEFETASENYILILHAKLSQINKVIVEKGGQEISLDEILEFYETIHAPIQAQADIMVAPFIDYKIQSYLNPHVEK